jgi:hypothetical protein
LVKIRIYFEGDDSLRPGFSKFFARGSIKAKCIAAGAKAEREYRKALATHPEALNILLRDSEGDAIEERPRVFWMIPLMEAWFLADPATLERYYGQGFQANALKKNRNVEEIPKQDVLTCLSAATKNTQKGRYHKTQHAPAILERINPALVRKAAPHCEALFTALNDA